MNIVGEGPTETFLVYLLRGVSAPMLFASIDPYMDRSFGCPTEIADHLLLYYQDFKESILLGLVGSRVQLRALEGLPIVK